MNGKSRHRETRGVCSAQTPKIRFRRRWNKSLAKQPLNRQRLQNGACASSVEGIKLANVRKGRAEVASGKFSLSYSSPIVLSRDAIFRIQALSQLQDRTNFLKFTKPAQKGAEPYEFCDFKRARNIRGTKGGGRRPANCRRPPPLGCYSRKSPEPKLTKPVTWIEKSATPSPFTSPRTKVFPSDCS